jgi:SsrA-binding protein
MPDGLVAKNKKAYYEYEILEEFEAGLVLVGTEVKSLREHRINLKESFARFKGRELWLEGCHISPYSHGNLMNHEPLRSRKLLLHKRELDKLFSKATEKGLTIVPLSLYFKRGHAKLRIGLGRGKKLYDKRETQRRKQIERDVQAELKRRNQ